MSASSWKTEADLCADFIAAVRSAGKWECYAETCGWDILLVRRADGVQIGIQAKLRFDAKVLNQAIENDYLAYSPTHPGPDYRAILVGRSGDLGAIAAYIGITVLGVRPEWRSHSIKPELPDEDRPWTLRSWRSWCPTSRHSLPAYVPDCPAGVPSPVRLTRWKIAAMKLAILIERRPLTRADFKALGIDHRRWMAWLTPTAAGWIKGPSFPDFRAAHPRNYAEIEADMPRWAPRDSAPLLFGA